jgi:hypothetical protein
MLVSWSKTPGADANVTNTSEKRPWLLDDYFLHGWQKRAMIVKQRLRLGLIEALYYTDE